MIIRDLVQVIDTALKTLYDDNESKRIAEWLIMDILQISHRFELYQHLNEHVDEHSLLYKRIQNKWRRLLRSEPIQYVTHKAWFMDMEFYVARGVLIPRPETEEMCRQLISDVDSNVSIKVLDVGTGSGCIAVSLKKYCPHWNIMATDVSSTALRIAQCNAKKHEVDVFWVYDNILNSSLFNNDTVFDIIVSNPPYIPENEKNMMHKNVVDYEPHDALFVPPDDPLLFYKAIVYFANNKLVQNGVVYVEIHEHFYQQIIDLFVQHRYETMLFYDIHNKPRYVKAIKL